MIDIKKNELAKWEAGLNKGLYQSQGNIQEGEMIAGKSEHITGSEYYGIKSLAKSDNTIKNS